jgi:adenylate kinase family enzyme
MAGNNNRLTDPKVLQFYKEKLHSMPCQNQGFVLDGFPKLKDHVDTFNNISVILWQSVLLVEETRVSEEDHRPVTSH